MTVDVDFGIVVVDTDGDGEYRTVEWPLPLPEDDGTSLQYTISSGWPHRSFSVYSFFDWLNRVPEADKLYRTCKKLHPNTNDPEIIGVDDTLLALVDAIPAGDEPLDADRARWFKYWAHRSRQEFADGAVVMFW